MTRLTTFEKHFTAVQSGRITKTNVIGIRKGFNAHWRASHRYSTGPTSPQWTLGDARAMMDAIKRHRPVALGRLHDQGLAKLRDKRNARYLSDKAQRVVNSRNARFNLISFTEIGRGQFYPVWRCIGDNGESFDYVSLPWQTVAYSRDEMLTPVMEYPA